MSIPSKFAAITLIAAAVKLSLSVLYTGFMAYSKILTSSKASASLFLLGLSHLDITPQRYLFLRQAKLLHDLEVLYGVVHHLPLHLYHLVLDGCAIGVRHDVDLVLLHEVLKQLLDCGVFRHHEVEVI